MAVSLKRIYEKPDSKDGYRVLVDRLWPRGISKDDAELDEWMKEIAPSDELRKWFHSNPAEWDEFRKRYLSELKKHKEKLLSLARRAKKEKVTLLFSSRNEDRNNALVLKQYLEMLKTH